MGDRPRVLVVDDEPMNLRILGEALRNNYRVSVTTCGRDALDIALTQQPELILLDVMMPDMDGFEVCRRLKADAATSAIPVVFITAMNQQESKAKGLALGAESFITKPIDPFEVQARVRSLLNQP